MVTQVQIPETAPDMKAVVSETFPVFLLFRICISYIPK